MTVPYLGSKISLISKAEIRYEGILYSIDQNESTVALAKVKSFGTEDRPTDRPVPPRDDVFEYIIFRGRDIKDLHVCAPPQPMSHDPAIVQSSDLITSPSNSNNNNSALSPSINPGVIGGYQSPPSGGVPPSQMMMYPFVGHPPPPGLTPPQKLQGSDDSPRLLAPIGHPSSSKSHPGQQSELNLSFGQAPLGLQSGGPNFGGTGMPSSVFEPSNDGIYPSASQGGYPRKDYGDEKQQSSLNNNDVSNVGDAGNAYGANEGNRNRGYQHYTSRRPEVPVGARQNRYQPSQQQQQQQPPQQQQQQHYYHNQQYSSPHYRQYTSYRGGSSMRGHPRGGVRRFGGPRGGTGSSGGRLKFEGEFDFESSNAQFDKEQIEKELKEKLTLGGSNPPVMVNTSVTNHHNDDADDEDEDAGNQEQPMIYYDKSKSFFDNLSCDATDKEKGRSNWREERKLNCETFGLPNTYGHGGSYYRGGRGYRSRPINHYGHYGGARGSSGWSYSNRGMGGERGYNRSVGGRRGRTVNPGQERS